MEKGNIMAKDITITVPVNTEHGKKIVSTNAQVSDNTISHEGNDFYLVKHTNSGFKFLAEQSVVDNLENSEADIAMSELEASEGM